MAASTDTVNEDRQRIIPGRPTIELAGSRGAHAAAAGTGFPTGQDNIGWAAANEPPADGGRRRLITEVADAPGLLTGTECIPTRVGVQSPAAPATT